MKKKILLIIGTMESGGVSKSMSSLLNAIDTKNYEVDCFILYPHGLFLNIIPDNINIIKDKNTELFFSTFPNSIFQLFKKGKFYLAFIRIIAAIFMKIDKGIGGWFLSKGIKKIKKEYDLAVDYNGQHQLYYLVDSVNAKVKASFFHSDYEKWPYYYRMDKLYFPKVDAIFTISEKCVQSLKKFFPSQASKIQIMENILSPTTINNLANEPITDSLPIDVLTLISVGHVSEDKGTTLAIKAAQILKQKEISFRWYFLGKNSQEDYFCELAKSHGVSNEIVFMGLRSNPYPYIKQANLFVHPSKFEGKSIALDEAKLLGKAIVVTNFSTVYDQFEDRFNASICEMNPEDLASKIEELYLNKELRNKYVANLNASIIDNSSEVNKLYRLVGN